MGLQGTIRDFGLADILQLLGIQRSTGVLTLEIAEDTVTVKFLDGQVVGADTKQRNLEDLLGSVLVRTGRITEAQLQEALRTQRNTLQRLGYILVKSRFISEEDLREALRIQVSQIVYRLFRWREGSYRFDRLDHVEYDVEHFAPIAAETILMEGARMIDEWPIIERRIKSAATVFRKSAAGQAIDAPVVSLVDGDVDFGFDASGEAAPPQEEIRLSNEERGVLHMVDGKSTVLDVVERSPLGEFDVYHCLYELLNRNLIEEVRKAADPGGLAAADKADRRMDAAGRIVVIVLAAVAFATIHFAPVSPWDLPSIRSETDQLKIYTSRARLDTLDRAFQLFYLDLGAVPERLTALAQAGYVRADEVLDPWDRPYVLDVFEGGYRLSGGDAGGAPRNDLLIERSFSATQRLLLDGPPSAETPDSSSAP